MKRAAGVALVVFAVLLFSAADASDVTSISINNCGVLKGNVRLVIEVRATSINDQPSNNCQADPDGTEHLTFYVPSVRP